MKRREFLAATALFGGSLAFGSVFTSAAMASAEPKRGGHLIWGHSETVQNLDIHQTGTASSARVLQNIHASIVDADKDLNVIPNVAESFELSEDGLTYTFKLRPGVKFHNGADLTSADVKYSFERCKDPATGAVNFEVFNAVSSIETPDALTVIVRLSTPNAPFLSRLAENGAGAILPVGSGDTQGAHPIGAGPFKFVSHTPGVVVELERFDDYFGGPAYLDRVTAREITENTTRLTGLQTGELHLINDIPPDRVEEVEGNAKLEVLKWYPLNFDFVNLNQQKFEPFKNADVRKAFDLIIDKEALLQGALWGQGKVSASAAYPTSSAFNHDLVQRAQDIAEAKKLLAAAGYGDGSLSVTFKVTTNYPYHVEAAQILVEWFREAGVKMNIVQLTWADWLSQCWVERDFEMTMMNFFTLWEPDRLFYSLWNTEGGFNYRSISVPRIDEITAQARVTIDPEARAALYKEVQQIVHDDTLDIILWHRNGSVAAQKSVKGLDTLVHPNGSNLRFERIWLDA